MPSIRRPPRVASQSFPPATTATPCDPGGTASSVVTGRTVFPRAPIRTCRFPVAASAAAPAPTAKATANATRTSPPRERRRLGPRASRAAARALWEISRVGFGRRSNPARSCCSSSVDIVHLIVGSKLLERAGQPGVDRAGGDSEQLADGGRGVAEPVAQDDSDAALQRQPRNGFQQLPVSVSDVVRLEPLELGVAADKPTLCAQEVEAAVDDDPVQPGTEGPPLVETRQRSERPLERVLGDIVGELAPPRDHVRRAPGGAPVAREELRRRVPRAAARELDELGVATHAHEHIVLRARPKLASGLNAAIWPCRTCRPASHPPP